MYEIHQVLLTRKKLHISTAATSTNNFHALSIYNPKLPIIIATADPRVEWHYFLKNIQDIEMHKTCNENLTVGINRPSSEYHKCIFWYPCDWVSGHLAVQKIVLTCNISHCSIYPIYINQKWKLVLKRG